MGTWLLLAVAIAAEVTATLSLKFTEGFTKLGPIMLVLAGYLVSFFLLAKVLDRGLPLSVVYAIWSAIGIAVLAVDRHDLVRRAAQRAADHRALPRRRRRRRAPDRLAPGMTEDRIDGRRAKGERARKALLRGDPGHHRARGHRWRHPPQRDQGGRPSGDLGGVSLRRPSTTCSSSRSSGRTRRPPRPLPSARPTPTRSPRSPGGSSQTSPTSARG